MVLETSRNTVVWKARFQELIAQEPSPVKPLARCCFYWRPLLGTAVTIMEDRGRSKSESIAAKLFLQLVDKEEGITHGDATRML